MLRKHKALIVLVLCVSHSHVASAQVFQCGQTWQNHPCAENNGIAAFEERNHAESTIEEIHLKKVLSSKKHLWSLEGRYPGSLILPLREAVGHCEARSVSDASCEESLVKAETQVSSEVERIDRERSAALLATMNRARERQEDLAIEKAKVEELRRQTALQEQQLAVQEQQLNQPREIILRRP